MDFNVAGIEDFGKVMDTFESFNPENCYIGCSIT